MAINAKTSGKWGRFSLTPFIILALQTTVVATADAATSTTRHYEYVFVDGSLCVYDIDNGFAPVKTITLPTQAGTRGAVADAASGMLYVSYGSTHTSGPGNLLKYDLIQDKIVWTKSYSFGVDSMSISPDGTTIYMPTGEESSGGIWKIISAADGSVTGSIDTGGTGPHNTIVNAAGTHVYMGPRYSPYLVEADASSHATIRKIGPISSTDNGVRPFTINSAETLAFITATGKLGFQVADIQSGKVLYDVPVKGFSWQQENNAAASHGISISPDEKEIYVIDQPNSYVHVFDITGLPESAPQQIADIALVNKMVGYETPCAQTCGKSGWLHHSRDGHYVFVGDSGDVIDTGGRKSVATLPAMENTRREIEIDFQNGVPVWAMANRSSIGGPITQLQANDSQGSRVSSISASFPRANTAGNTIIAFVRISTATDTVTLSDSLGNVYMNAISQSQSTDGHQTHWFYAKNIKGGTNTVTASFSAINNHPYIAIYEYKGLSTVSPLDQVGSAQGYSASPSCATPATTSAHELAFTGLGMTSNFTGTASAGTDWIIEKQDNSTSRAATQSQLLFFSDSINATFSLSDSADWSCVVATFH